jgi:thioredoxin reductase/ferredoxin
LSQNTNTTLQDGTYVLADPVSLPDVLDVLVVGGGPAGTAAAFRAKELGMSALVVDFDDLLKRIRDYAKNKPILPSFGGGDKMRFPKGGELTARLHFEPIDKDDMCADWKRHYQEASVPAQIGVELTGLERQTSGIWSVRTWNHRVQAEHAYLARHVIIAIGRGVPRRFDIPGNTDGISYRLDDAEKYVGSPCCIVGGGTSAAEAVIAISNAKAAAQDPSPVYWSYRGDKMPKVSRALSQVFFDAYMGNGNIRHHANSEPVAVFTSADKAELLSVRIDRRSLEGRPHETSHLEFDKRFCIACIGEDLPESFLNTMGIFLATGGPRGRKRMVVSPLLESEQENVYLVGDILSQAYLETDDFEADPASFREVKHPGNVKSALRDGVFVAEVIRQKLDGKEHIRIALEFEESTEAEVRPVPVVPAASDQSEGPPPESIPEDRRVQTESAEIVRLTPGGVDEDVHPLRVGSSLSVGRAPGPLSFPDDDALADQHASFVRTGEGISVKDEGSETGTFFRLPPGNPVSLADGDLIQLGRQFLLFQVGGSGAGYIHYGADGQELSRQDLAPDVTFVLGRDAPDATLDSNDFALSRRHLSLVHRSDGLFAKDLKSLNHSYLRVTTERGLEDEDVVRVGRQLLRLNLLTGQESGVTSFQVKPAAPGRDPMGETTTPGGTQSAEPSVTFQKEGVTVEVPPRKTLCDVAEKNGITLNAECHAGVCGSDPIRIVSGGEFLNKISEEESDTLEDICDLTAGNQPGGCRLACMTRATGPVVVEIVTQD